MNDDPKGGKTSATGKAGPSRADLEARVAELEAELSATRRRVDQLRGSERIHRLLEDNVRDIIWTTDLDLRFTYMSPSVAAMTGFTVQEALQLSAADVLTPQSLRKAGEILTAELALEQAPAADARRSVFVELEQRRKDGSIFPIEATISFLRDGGGRPVGVLGVTRDATERIRAEAERRELEQQVQHAQRLESLGVLASGIAHDFNNILTGLLINANLALTDLPADSPVRPLVTDIEEAARRASELTGQILAYAGGSMANCRLTDITALVQGLSERLGRVETAGVGLTYELASGLPPVRADAAQLEEVVEHLVANAVEAASATHGRVWVRTFQTDVGVDAADAGPHFGKLSPGRHVAIEVADTGSGMDAETAQRAFEPFFTTKSFGRGLGLSVAQGLVRGHDGAIFIDTTPGRGTRLRVVLPAAAKGSARATSSRPSDEWRGRGTILLVDDERIVRTGAARLLRRAGFEVLEAADGEQAVELYRGHHADLACVILDLTMPRMDGRQAFGAMQTINPAVPVILASGYGEAEATEGFPAGTLAGFLKKPFDTRNLRSALGKVLSE